jgi:hypothetical protein
MNRTNQKLFLLLDETRKKLLRAKIMTTMADEWHKEIEEALEKITLAKEKVMRELDT